jgi:glycine cleavage system H lipoate-binding protein
MAVILVIICFAIFIVVDLAQARRQREIIAAEGRALHEKAHEKEPHWVAGYELPEHLHYHQGHTWVHWVSPDQAYVGVDDFARRLLGKHTHWSVPSVGAWVQQGEGVVSAAHTDKKTRLSSPLTGEVVATNRRLKRDSELVHRESYGNGWLFKVRSPRLAEQFENLLQGRLARRWMEDVRDRFQNQLVVATGNVVQDGGTTVDNLDEELDPVAWSNLVDEFLATKANRY